MKEFITTGNTLQEMLKGATREKQLVQGKPHKAISRYFSRNLQARREWHDIFKKLKGKKISLSRILYLSKLSLRTGGEIKNFPHKLLEFIITKAAPQDMLKIFL